MATITKTINDKLYRLHTTKADGVSIGSVPVLEAKTVQELVDNYSLQTILMDWHTGCSIRLQAQARQSVSSKSISPKQWSKIAAGLLAEDAERYEGKFDVLDTDVRAEYANQIDEVSATADKIWEELL